MEHVPYYIDLHCHPSLKPYGKSFNSTRKGANSIDHRRIHSIWYYDPPRILDRFIQLACGIAKFRQADCHTLMKANCRFVFASLYPLERGFFRNKLGQGIASDLVNDFATSVGKGRINHIQGIKNYFEDLLREYDYYLHLHDKPIKIHGKHFRYRMVKHYQEVLDYHAEHDRADHTVFIAPSIEGMHVLNNNIDEGPDHSSMLNNVQAIKNWDYPPFFVTFAHHFYNHLCGHARSLFDIVGRNTDQEEGLGTGFTPTGVEVMHALLSKTNGRRIYIDIKHMSLQARKEFFQLLDSDPYKNERIPLIVSHGAAAGISLNGKGHLPEIGDTFMQADINFYDEEIVRIARSGGLFGLQLDERRLINSKAIKNIKQSAWLNKIQHYRAGIVWNQVQYIAELLDRHDLPAWGTIALGTDHDGIINPLNGYLTSENLNELLSYLERYAFTYMNEAGKKILKPENHLAPSDIVNKIFSGNAHEFLKKWFV